jgi:hypothetical protein
MAVNTDKHQVGRNSRDNERMVNFLKLKKIIVHEKSLTSRQSHWRSIGKSRGR